MPIYLQSQLVTPPDSGMGALYRPGVTSLSGERIASLETLYSFFIDAVMDPDKTLSKDAAFYEKLLRHPWVSACMNIREQKVASMKTRVDAPEDFAEDPMAQAARKWVATCWSGIKDKDLIFQEMEQAVLFGGQPHEWMWSKFSDGTQRPVRAEPVHKTRVQFNRQGDMALLTRLQPVWGAFVGSNPSNPQQPHSPLPMGKFTYHKYQRLGGSWQQPGDEAYNYYGKGEGEDLYDLVIRDIACWLLEMAWLKRYGNPAQILYTPETSFGQGAQWSGWIDTIVDSILTKQITPVPDSQSSANRRLFELVMPAVPAPSFDAFGKARDRNYDGIEAILLGSVGVLSHEKGEGRASHESRQDSGPDMLMRRDATRISGTFSSQLVPAMLRYGPPDVQQCPQELMPSIVLYDEQAVKAEDLDAAAKLVKVPTAFVYKSLHIPAPAKDESGVEEETVYTGGQSDPFQDLADGGDDPNAVGQNKEKADGSPQKTLEEARDRTQHNAGKGSVQRPMD